MWNNTYQIWTKASLMESRVIWQLPREEISQLSLLIGRVTARLSSIEVFRLWSMIMEETNQRRESTALSSWNLKNNQTLKQEEAILQIVLWQRILNLHLFQLIEHRYLLEELLELTRISELTWESSRESMNLKSLIGNSNSIQFSPFMDKKTTQT